MNPITKEEVITRSIATGEPRTVTVEKPLIASSWTLIINDDFLPLPPLKLGDPTRHYGDPEDPEYLAACQRVAQALWDGEFE